MSFFFFFFFLFDFLTQTIGVPRVWRVETLLPSLVGSSRYNPENKTELTTLSAVMEVKHVYGEGDIQVEEPIPGFWDDQGLLDRSTSVPAVYNVVYHVIKLGNSSSENVSSNASSDPAVPLLGRDEALAQIEIAVLATIFALVSSLSSPLSVSLSLSLPSVYLSVSLCFSLSHFVLVCQSLFVLLSLSISPSLSVHQLSVSVCLCVCVSVCLSVSLNILRSRTFTLKAQYRLPLVLRSTSESSKFLDNTNWAVRRLEQMRME